MRDLDFFRLAQLYLFYALAFWTALLFCIILGGKP